MTFQAIYEVCGGLAIALVVAWATYHLIHEYLANKKQELYDRARLDVPLWTRRKR